ncbi:MAG TPA: hypothetical protein VG457_19005 [Planctomycetota bacterium]|jgi:uncharacterized membrane protein YvbJ|nr:hypothetical protein [Planctomycetota bacterium]
MAMTCPSCGRPLASGAKCVYCGQGSQFKRKEQLVIPQGTTKPTKKSFGIPWKTLLVLLILGGVAMAVARNPEWLEKFRELIKF